MSEENRIDPQPVWQAAASSEHPAAMDARERAAQKVRRPERKRCTHGLKEGRRTADSREGAARLLHWGATGLCMGAVASPGVRRFTRLPHGAATRPQHPAAGSPSAAWTVAGRDGASDVGRRHQEGRDGGGVVETCAALRQRPQQPVQVLPFDAQSAGIARVQLHRHQTLRRPRAASLQPDRTAVRIVEGGIPEAR